MSAEKDYPSLPLREFLADLAGRLPTPGGGSAAAVVGGLACAVARMVLEYSIGRPESAGHDDRLRELLSELKQWSGRFERLVVEDIDAYQAVIAAGKLDQAAREQANARAIHVPMEITTRAGNVVARMNDVKTFLNPRLLGDLRAVGVLGFAAARCASWMVRANLPMMSDRKQAAELDGQLDAVLDWIGKRAHAIEAFDPGDSAG